MLSKKFSFGRCALVGTVFSFLMLNSAESVIKSQDQLDRSPQQAADQSQNREDKLNGHGNWSRKPLRLLYAPGQMIVKFKDDAIVGAVAHELLEDGRRFETITANRNLDNLNKKYRLKQIRPVFNSKVQQEAGSGEVRATNPNVVNEKKRIEYARRTQSITARYSKRARRAPRSAEVPYLGNIYRFEFEDTTVDIPAICAQYAKDESIEYAHPNYRYTIELIPDDPLYSQQWAHQMTQAEPAWDIETGNKDVVIAIIDTGVDFNHEDLAENIWRDAQGKPGNDFVDIDIAEYIDDGYQLVSGEDYIDLDDDPQDYHGHGTHCAGIAAGIGSNATGISGVCPGCEIMPVRAGFSIIHPTGVETGILEDDDIAHAVIYAVDNGADILSMSFGGPGSPTLKAAMEYAFAHGAIAIAAIGNNSSDRKSYPAAYDSVIAVTATTDVDYIAPFSNFGFWADIAAPGDDILSTVPLAGTLGDPSGYRELSGTSMACPYVAGTAALIISHFPLDTVLDVKRRLYGGAEDKGSSGWDEYYGFGRINVLYSLQPAHEHLLARILKPQKDGFYKENISIDGTATGSDFSHYVVETGAGNYPQNWTNQGITLTGGGAQPVFEGNLASLDIAGLPDGIYSLRLSVFDGGGQSLQMKVTFNLDTLLQSGWPQATLYGSGSYNTTLIVADLEDDGQQEILAGSYEGLLYVWRHDGSPVEGFPKEARSYGGETLTPAVGNLDGDPQLEIVAVSNGTHPYGEWPDLFVFNHDGTDVPGWPVISPNYMSDPPTLADTDNDGDLEILLGHENWKVYAYHHTGETSVGWPARVDHGQNVSGVSVADIDNDGDVELLAGNDNFLYAWHHADADGDGRADPVDGWPVEVPEPSIGYNETIFVAPAIGDVDGDGQMEIIATAGAAKTSHEDYQVFMWKSNGQVAPAWPQIVEQTVQWSSVALGDMDNDGIAEIIAGGEDGRLWVWKGNGVVLDGFPVALGRNFSRGLGAVIGDVDGDDYNEIVVGGGDGIFILEHDGRIKSGWPKSYDIEVTPAIGDLDGDGDLEVVAYGEDDRVYVWDLIDEEEAIDRKMDWPMLGQNSRHSGIYAGPNQPPAITAIGTQEVDEGDELVFYVQAEDPDGEELWYTAGLANGDPLERIGADFTKVTLGDLDWDGVVDGMDLAAFSKCLGGARGQSSNYDPLCDFNNDAVIDREDLSNLAGNFGLPPKHGTTAGLFLWKPSPGHGGQVYEIIIAVTDHKARPVKEIVSITVYP
jgi:subtilisin family serine protease